MQCRYFKIKLAKPRIRHPHRSKRVHHWYASEDRTQSVRSDDDGEDAHPNDLITDLMNKLQMKSFVRGQLTRRRQSRIVPIFSSWRDQDAMMKDGPRGIQRVQGLSHRCRIWNRTYPGCLESRGLESRGLHAATELACLSFKKTLTSFLVVQGTDLQPLALLCKHNTSSEPFSWCKCAVDDYRKEVTITTYSLTTSTKVRISYWYVILAW